MSRKKSADSDRTSVKVDKELARRLNTIAAHRDISLQDLVAEVLIAYADEEYPKLADEIRKGH